MPRQSKSKQSESEFSINLSKQKLVEDLKIVIADAEEILRAKSCRTARANQRTAGRRKDAAH